MKRNVITFFALALTTLALGCSGKSGSGGDKGNGGGMLKPQALSEQPWCSNHAADNYQDKVTLSPDGHFLLERFELSDAGRGQSMGQADGTWGVENNNTLVITPTGQATVRKSLRFVDKAQSPDGAAQMIIDGNTFNPCM